MPLMNNITKTLKETFKPRKRRAAIGGILGPIMIVIIVIAGVGVLAAMFFDLADTASIVDSIEISNQAIYSEQGFVTVQVKNGGNTGIDTIEAKLLIVALAGGTKPNCAPGTVSVGILNATTTGLSPGESRTISGSLATTSTCAKFLEDRGEYILQIVGGSGAEEISKTVTIRAR